MTTAANFTAAQAAEEDVTTSLYRAAIGPVSTPYYLPIFTRFEEAEHAGISWNTAASLTTLNWLVFRKLWGAALAYVGIVVAIVLLVFGIGSLEVQYSETLIVALGLGPLGAAFYLWDAALKRGDARQIGVLSFLTPLLSTLALLLVRGEMPSWSVGGAAGLIMGAAVLGTRPRA